MPTRRAARPARLFLLTLLTLLPVRVLAGEPSPGMELQHTAPSPRGDILVEHYFNKEDSPREVWLASSGQPSDRVLLYTHSRSVEVLFSPDQRWLIVNDLAGSNEAEPYLFRRVQGLHHSLVKNAQIGEKVWRFVGRWYPVVLTTEFGHRYVQVMRWASDSRAFLVAAFGHLDNSEKERALDPWLCVFTIDGLHVSLDLGLMNRGALHSRTGGETPPSGPWK